MTTDTASRIDEHVPKDIRLFAEWFCEWYGINGSCDPMYVCNVIASKLNRGDGQGGFIPGSSDETHNNPKLAAIKHLRFSYSTSIKESGRKTTDFNDLFDIWGKKVRRLTCCCCGQETTGRQWWNRDTGYGLCVDCIEFVSRNISHDEVRSCYGIRGVHYDPAKGAPSHA